MINGKGIEKRGQKRPDDGEKAAFSDVFKDDSFIISRVGLRLAADSQSDRLISKP